MLKSMQLVFPLNAQIQMEVISRYGFPGDNEGEIPWKHIKLTETIHD